MVMAYFMAQLMPWATDEVASWGSLLVLGSANVDEVRREEQPEVSLRPLMCVWGVRASLRQAGRVEGTRVCVCVGGCEGVPLILPQHDPRASRAAETHGDVYKGV